MNVGCEVEFGSVPKNPSGNCRPGAVSAALKGFTKLGVMRTNNSELLYRIKAKLYVDATGDSRLGLEAGAEMRSGREARGEFNEPLAPIKADARIMPCLNLNHTKFTDGSNSCKAFMSICNVSI